LTLTLERPEEPCRSDLGGAVVAEEHYAASLTRMSSWYALTTPVTCTPVHTAVARGLR
jgi:hypothetical protein